MKSSSKVIWLMLNTNETNQTSSGLRIWETNWKREKRQGESRIDKNTATTRRKWKIDKENSLTQLRPLRKFCYSRQWGVGRGVLDKIHVGLCNLWGLSLKSKQDSLEEFK